MASKTDEVNGYCNAVYGKSYHEIFGFDNLDSSDVEHNLISVKRKNDFIQSTTNLKDDKVTFLSIWRSYWNSVVVKQPILCELYAMCAMSQLMKHIRVIRSGGVEDDIRIHICTIMPSGTGKSEGNDVLATFARQMGLIYSTVDKYNDASLVGSVNRQAIDFNVKHNKRPGDMDYMDPDEKGILRRSDIVVFDEGENILKTTPLTEGAQRYLQKAMNRYMSEGNYIANTLVGHQVGGHPDCNIVITSYYLDEFQETLLDRGLLQRMIVLIQDENYDTRTSIIDSIVDSIPTFDEDPEETTEYIRSLKSGRIDHIAHLRTEATNLVMFHSDTATVNIKSDAKIIIRDGIKELRELMPFQMGQQQIWESMVTRMAVNLLKMASVHALINYRKYIDVDDAKYASSIMMQTMMSMAFFLRENVKTVSDKKTLNLHMSLKRNHIGETYSMEHWVSICIKTYNLSEGKSKMMIRNMIDNKKMEEITKEGKRLYIIK